jgi:signal peptidase I
MSEKTAKANASNNTNAIQENLEAIVVAIVLALMIRHYAMEAFVIPTGSMAPTLLGEHYTLDCENCGENYTVNRTNNRGFEARCELCDHAMRINAPERDGRLERPLLSFGQGSPLHGGNKILVNKLIYRTQEPERLDVIVFKFPEDSTRNFIKRLVGLPGERLRIEHGDLFVNGERVRKDPETQRHLWHQMYDQQKPSREGTPEPWKPDSPGRWGVRRRGQGAAKQIEQLDDRVDPKALAPEAFVAAPGPRRTRIEFQRDVRDDYSYNYVWKEGTPGSAIGGEHVVTDLELEVEIIPLGGGGPVTLALVENGTPLRLELPVGQGAAELRLVRPAADHSAAVERRAPCPALTPGRPTHVRFSWYDRRAVVEVDGAERLRWDDPEPKLKPQQSRAFLEAPKSGAVFQRLALRRDIHYFLYVADSPPVSVRWDEKTREIIIPDDAYFALGDNCPNSSDGRKWGYVRKGHLVGRAFAVFWPLDAVRLIH